MLTSKAHYDWLPAGETIYADLITEDGRRGHPVEIPRLGEVSWRFDQDETILGYVLLHGGREVERVLHGIRVTRHDTFSIHFDIRDW